MSIRKRSSPLFRILLLLGTAGVVLLALLIGRQAKSPTAIEAASAVTVGIPAEVSPSTDLLRIHFIDVGQGDSIFIQSPDGATALIDGGNPNGMAMAYLHSLNISRIDALIATHPHTDHIGGLVDVMQLLPIGGVWTSGASHTTGIFERFIDTIDIQKIPYHEVRQGEGIPLGSLTLSVLASDANAGTLNDTSLVLHLTYGEISFLFTGDAELPLEAAMLQTVADRLPATILKVGHHGSGTSSSPAFLAAIRPQVAIYSAGAGNSYGHPHAQTISNLSVAGATIYGTAVHGTVQVATDGVTYTIQTTFAAPPILGQPIMVREVRTAMPELTELPSGSLKYDPKGQDRDCAAFSNRAEVQAFFLAAGGPENDPHGLDRDDDGIPCESLR